MEVIDYGKFEAARRHLQAARDAKVREDRLALARCAEKYLMGACGYERAAPRMGEPSAITQRDGSSAGARADVRDWRVNRSV
jgi:hypothetical protein